MERFPYSELNESQLMDQLQDSIKDSSKGQQIKRISCLEEILRRINSGSFEDLSNLVKITLDTATSYGCDQPESALITDILEAAINEDLEILKMIIEHVHRQVESESHLFIVFSKLVLKLDYKKRQQTLKTLVKFLVKSDILNRAGTSEVYNCLIQIGKEKLGAKIVEIVTPFLDSLETSPIIYSVRLCSEFAGKEQIDKMVGVLEKSMKEYYGARHVEIERRLCRYFERIGDPNSLPHLLNLLRYRGEENTNDKSKAIASILNAHPYKIDYVLDVLYDVRDDKKLVDGILKALEDAEIAIINAHRLLSNIRIKYWFESPTRFYVKRILVRGGQSSKPVLFDMMKDEEKCEYALECLKEIGVSTDELVQVFSEPLMLQVYKFVYSQKGSRFPQDLNVLWSDRDRLGGNIPGNTSRLEHLILHIFSSFSFVTLNVAPLGLESVDIICFLPETLDLIIIGCTTGVLKDDLKKLDAFVTKMHKEMPNLFETCKVTPMMVTSKPATVYPSDAKYARQTEMVILQDYDIDKLLEMLSTNRKPRSVIEFIEKRKWEVTDLIDDD